MLNETTTPSMKHILIVENYPVIRLATKKLLLNLYKDAIIHEAASFSAALVEIEACEQNMVILDDGIPEGQGFQMIRTIRDVQKSVPILVFSANEERVYGIHYLHFGANGFIAKNSTLAELRTAILSIAESGRYISNKIGVELLNQLDKYNYRADNPLLELSPREITIMDLLLEGLWIKEIAARLNLKASSISTYKERIFEKLQVSTLIEMFQSVKGYKDMD